MLYITTRGKTASWHVGEPLPFIPASSVVTFQADGDELDWLVRIFVKEWGAKLEVSINGLLT